MRTKTAKPAPALSLDLLKGLGAPRIEALRAAGFSTLRALLFHLPKGHLDRATVTPVAQLAEGEHTIRAKVRTLTVPRFRRRVDLARDLRGWLEQERRRERVM